MFIAVAGFVFPHTMQSLLDETFTDKIITSYREDPDLQNLIDFGQKKVCIDTVTAKITLTYFVFLNLVPVLWSQPQWVHGLAKERVFQLQFAQRRELWRAILLLY